MLAVCHHRIQQQGMTLQRLVAHLATRDADAHARVAAAAVMRYFDTAAKDHHADEEVDLFPALIESMAGSDARCLRELIDSLKADHRSIETQWHCLRAKLARIAAGEAQALLADDVHPLIASYEAHIAREEAELLPMAARLLSDTALEGVGRAMRERRGVVMPT